MDDNLPPLPKPDTHASEHDWAYSTDAVRLAQREAYEAGKRAALAAQPVAPEFDEAACRKQCGICPGVHDNDHWPCAKAAARRRHPQPPAQPVAWMWQHDETGRVGFVDQWQLENGWRENNPRLHVTTPLYATPQPQGEDATALLREAARNMRLMIRCEADQREVEACLAAIDAAIDAAAKGQA